MSDNLKERILSGTQDGLDIILDLVDGADSSNKKKKFKLHKENTPSSNLFEDKKTKEWKVRNHGTGETFSCFDLYMKEHRLSFGEALKELAGIYLANEDGTFTARKPGYERLPIVKGEEPESSIMPAAEFTDAHLAIFNPKVLRDNDNAKAWKEKLLSTLKNYGCVPLTSYTIIPSDKDKEKEKEKEKDKKKEAHRWLATENYPMLAWQHDGWSKVYVPYNEEKQYRFQIIGKGKSSNYLAGLDYCTELCEELRLESMDDEDGLTSKKAKLIKLERVIICPGEKDAMNVASMGYPVVWMNSETAMLTPYQWNELRAIAYDIFYLGDIDATGKKQAHEIGIQYLDLRIIRLPDSLLKKKDWRKKPCKDLTDWLRFNKPYDFTELLNVSYPYRFWDLVEKYDAKGNYKGVTLQFNNTFCDNFLGHQGFYRYPRKNDKSGYMLIKVEDHIARKAEPLELQNFCEDFLTERKTPVHILNLIKRTNQIIDKVHRSLPVFTGSFDQSDQDRQFWFFSDKVWEITADEISVHQELDSGRFVWDNSLIRVPGHPDHEVKLVDPGFEVFQNEDGQIDVNVKNHDHPFFQFLINTSRTKWKEEFDRNSVDHYLTNAEYAKLGLNRIDGDKLSESEKREQKQHLLNKMAALGYLLHTYKDPARAWAIWVTDNSERDIYESHGGTGKSVLIKGIRYFLRTDYHEGRDKKLTDNTFLFQNVDQDTNLVWVDDCSFGVDFSRFFSSITGDMKIRPMYAAQFELAFEQSPKFVFTSNYSLKKLDPSTRRRLWYMATSDFYHYSGSEFSKTKDPRFDLEQNLFEFTPAQWEQFYSILATCVQTYLKFGKIEPPLNNVERQNLRTSMGEDFLVWADEYFQDKVKWLASGTCEPRDHEPDRDFYQSRKVCLAAFNKSLEEMGAYKWKMNRFSKAVENWCNYHGHFLNPQKTLNSQDRNQQKIDSKTEECFYFLGYYDPSDEGQVERALANDKSELF